MGVILCEFESRPPHQEISKMLVSFFVLKHSRYNWPALANPQPSPPSRLWSSAKALFCPRVPRDALPYKLVSAHRVTLRKKRQSTTFKFLLKSVPANNRCFLVERCWKSINMCWFTYRSVKKSRKYVGTVRWKNPNTYLQWQASEMEGIPGQAGNDRDGYEWQK